MRLLILGAAALLILSACSDKGETSAEADDDAYGYEDDGGDFDGYDDDGGDAEDYEDGGYAAPAPPIRAEAPQSRGPQSASAPAGLQVAQIIDQRGFERPMVASTVLVPAGWRSEGGVVWDVNATKCGRLSPYTQWRAVAPDGLGMVDLLPGEAWMGHNLPQAVPGYEQCPNVQITDPKQFILQYAQRLRPGARILDYKDVSGDVQELLRYLPPSERNPYGGETRSWVGAGQALIAYQVNGQEVRELIGTAVMFTSNLMPAMGGPAFQYTSIIALPGFAMRARSGQLDFALAEQIRTSIKQNPAYEQKMAAYNAKAAKIQADSAAKIAAINRQGAADRSKIIANTGSEILDMQMQTYRNSTASGDYIQRESSEAVRGVETYNDQVNGGTVELDNTYNHNYQLENGNIVQTNDPNFNVLQETGQFGTEMEVTQ